MLSVVVVLGLLCLHATSAAEFKLTLPERPPCKDWNGLAPHISEQTLRLHYGKHQAGYVAKVDAWLQANQALVNSKVQADELAGRSLVTLLCLRDDILEVGSSVHNAACQAYNHALYFAMLRQGALQMHQHHHDHTFHRAFGAAFGGFEKFKQVFTDKALAHFGSGWVWLVHDTGRDHDDADNLRIVETHDAGVPDRDPAVRAWVKRTVVPLLVLDVWEHAYYTQRENRRAEYIAHWFQVVDWQKVADRFDRQSIEEVLEDEEAIEPGEVEYPRF